MADRSNRKRLCAIPTDISINSLGRNITSRTRRQGYKFFVQGFIHDICFDEPCTEEVVVSARCYRSMRKNAKPHRLIINLHLGKACTVIAVAQQGKCSHVVGLVQALMHYQEWGMKEVPADMSYTQLQQLWGRPRKAKIQPESVLTVAVTKPVEGGHRCRKRKPVKHVSLSDRYKDMHQWQDTTLAFYPVRLISDYEFCIRPRCALLHQDSRQRLSTISSFCNKRTGDWGYALCEQQHPENSREHLPQHCPAVSLKSLNITNQQLYVFCSRNHITHKFLACNRNSACFSTYDVSFGVTRESWGLPRKHSCHTNMTSLPPSFACTSGDEHVPYTLVCDYRKDCLDNSDEDFCVFPACDAALQFQCESKQCVGTDELCDYFIDCLDETDEWFCQGDCYTSRTRKKIQRVITFNGRGGFYTTRLPNWTSLCPDTHFKCLSAELCMPVYVRCNGVSDCPEKEDEEGCDIITCPGFYRCRGFMNTFLHPDHLCDGWPQCPQHDDERYCNMTCPAQCSCLGHSWFCRQIFQANMYPLIRFLDAESSGMKPSGLTKNLFLIHLSLSKCDVHDFDSLYLPNLHSLDLEGNRMQAIRDVNLKGLLNLNTLFLTGNPLTSVFSVRTKPTVSFPRLTRLDLSNIQTRSFNSSLLDPFPNLQTLNLSGCGIESMTSMASQFVPKLHVLDMRGCPLVSFSSGTLKSLTRLSAVRADNFKVCCPVSLPDSFRSSDCESEEDKISSCDDLFESNLYRLSWHLTSYMALVCNVAILFKRLNGRSRTSSSTRSPETSAVDVFLTSLYVCGSVHAVYMAIIGFADVFYRGSYVLHDTAWKQGSLCAAAGFLWLLSLEISLFLTGLMTLDRVLVSWCFPTSWRFSFKSAVAAISVLVFIDVLLALPPLLPSLLRWKRFQQSALCSPLLLANQEFPGSRYIFGVFSVFNVTLSWLVGIGQLSVYIYLHKKRFAFVQSPNQTKELSTSRRVMTLVLCDVVYWLVIGHIRHFTAMAMTTPDNVVVLAQILVMPFNWTLKPILHIVATLLEHRRRDQEERMLKILIAKRHD